MAGPSASKGKSDQKDSSRSNSSTSTAPSKLDIILGKFSRKRDSRSILTDLAPIIMHPTMTPRMLNSANNTRSRKAIQNSSSFATLGRAPLRLGFGSTRRMTSRDLQIVEATEELLDAEVPEPDGVASNVSLLRGFNATIPSAEKSRTRRRQMRNVDTPRIGLKKLGQNARGLISEGDDESGSVASEDDVVLVESGAAKRNGKRRGRESLSASKILGKDELTRQRKEILRDKENIHVKRSLINSEIEEITRKIDALDAIRSQLENDLLKLQEDELELDDEMEGVKERLEFEETPRRSVPSANVHVPQSSRRRKGPAFLPSEHDELPPGVAFMTLDAHTSPITALDFSEPYGTLVTSSEESSQVLVWDLLTGSEISRLKGHRGAVKTVQVEGNICLTGGNDGDIRVWDLGRVEDEDGWAPEMISVPEEHEDEDGELVQHPNGIRNSEEASELSGACTRVLGGHSKAVTALYFEDNCLVTGASDKTLRQWDLSTGQCVMTMDILWAISHPPVTTPGGHYPDIVNGAFSVPMPPLADGSWDMYQDFVGGVQFWGYGLVSGSGDGAVRMWDMRTGQAHRTLWGHTSPVTCVQFDELHIVSGSLDKTVRIWDLRTGGVFETLKYDYPVTALQFDTRKVVSAAGENGVKIYNRTSMQHSTLQTNGHTKPVQRMRYMDRYMVSGGRDNMVKIWSL